MQNDHHNGRHSFSHDNMKRDYPLTMQTIWNFAGGRPVSNRPEELVISITDPKSDPVERFLLSHEKLMHLILVRKDLSFFNHYHPEYKGGGTFTCEIEFPAGGEYKLFAEFYPEDGKAQLKTYEIDVEGQRVSPPPEHLSSIRSVDGLEIELQTTFSESEGLLRFTFKDDQTKEPFYGLQPYLGAMGHVVILSEHAAHYLHSHPLEQLPSKDEVQFITNYPSTGLYKIWGQFKHDGKVTTVPYLVHFGH